MVRNFGKKMQTIFKKGLSLSIAMALGVAATSLNLAKTADADQPTLDGSVRTVYLAGEAIDMETGVTAGDATHVKINNAGEYITGDDLSAYKLTPDVTSIMYSDGTTDAAAATTVTVYNWADIYKQSGITMKHGEAINTQFTGETINFNGTDANSAAIRTLLGSATYKIGGTVVTGNVNYASHNGKKMVATVNGVECDLGTLTVSRSASKLELLSAPTALGYYQGKKISMDGLKIKVSYSVGEAVEVAWTKDNAKDFTFTYGDANTELSNDAAMIAEGFENVHVKYDGKEIEDAFSFVCCSTTLVERKTALGSVSGNLKSDVQVTMKAVTEGEAFEALKKEAGNAAIIKTIEVVVDPAACVGDLTFRFNLGKAYAGKTVSVLQLSGDNLDIHTPVTVGDDGFVEVYNSHASTFMIVEGAVATGTAKEETKAEAGKDAAADKKEEAATKESGSSKSGGSVKTGDNAVVVMSSLALVALLSYVALVLLKKKSGANA